MATLSLISATVFAIDINGAFNSLDKDNNSVLSEAEASEDVLLHENFAQIDTDQNGQLSLDEFKQFVK